MTDGKILDDGFTPPKLFLPIDEAAKDGQPQLVKGGDDGMEYAAAYWVGDMWAYHLRDLKPAPVVQIDFEPTHYAEKATGI